MNQKFVKQILVDNGSKSATTLTNNRDVIRAKKTSFAMQTLKVWVQGHMIQIYERNFHNLLAR